MRKEIKNMKYCESELIEKEREYNEILNFIKRFKKIKLRSKEFWVGDTQCYTFNKEDVNILCKYFEEERLNKLRGEIQLLKKECTKSI